MRQQEQRLSKPKTNQKCWYPLAVTKGYHVSGGQTESEEKGMFPNIDTAQNELKIAGECNPGPWTAHCQNAASAARLIASQCVHLDADKAYVLGLLHDIGRRTGRCYLRHTIDGYDYAMSKGWDEVARICLTHSFPIQDIEADIAKKDITEEQYDFIKDFIENNEYDDYDKLIILCDSLADIDGFCVLEKRFVDTTRRYGAFRYTVERWNKTFQYKKYFEDMIGTSIYKILPGIEACIYR